MARDSNGQDPWQLPDGFELNEDFIRGGVYEPPARTRESIARYGGQPTSWRHGGEPVGMASSPPPGPRPGRRGKAIAVLGAVTVALALAATLLHRPGSGPTSVAMPNLVRARAANPTASITPSPADTRSAAPMPSSSNAVHGINPADPIGTCYRSAQPTKAVPAVGQLNLAVVDCRQPHSFELASYESAVGSDATYPGVHYWQQTVSQACYRDLLGYTKKARALWPANLRPDNFIPTTDGWKTGDRTVYCLAHSSPQATGSVRG